MSGDASVYLPAINFVLLLYSRSVADFITQSGFKLTAASDYDFMRNVLTMLQTLFAFTPSFVLSEFFTPGQAVTRKLSFLVQVIGLVKQKQEALRQKRANSKTKQVTFRQEDSVAFPYYDEAV
jgi:hypothetical protein